MTRASRCVGYGLLDGAGGESGTGRFAGTGCSILRLRPVALWISHRTLPGSFTAGAGRLVGWLEWAGTRRRCRVPVETRARSGSLAVAHNGDRQAFVSVAGVQLGPFGRSTPSFRVMTMVPRSLPTGTWWLSTFLLICFLVMSSSERPYRLNELVYRLARNVTFWTSIQLEVAPSS